ncbi:SGNH family lipase [Acidothermaceae bacterium B102]|nr:SGNH family lipase [Acidothermaceae bacterium B102]
MYAVRALTAVVLAGATLLAGPSASAAAPAPVFVALGDSYSSGEGACAPVTVAACGYLHGTAVAADECHRSKNAYAVRVKATLPKSWQLAFAACSGATTADVLTDSLNGEPAQISVLADAKAAGRNVKLVTLTLGGNDVGFADAVGTCVAAHTFFGSSCGGKITWAVSTATLRTRLAAVYQAVHGLAPNARVLVLGYPRLFSPTPSATAPCPVAAVDSRALSKAENVLNATIASAVAHADKVAGKKFATFVDDGALFKGHELCAGPAAKSYLNGLVLTSGAARPESFHPNRVGQSVLAKHLEKVLKG